MLGRMEHRLFAAVYDRMLAPLERDVLGARRQALLGSLTGEVLDVGAGTGVNLAYLASASRVVAAEPDAAMRRRLVAKAAQAPVPVEVSDAGAERLPLPDASFDAVLFTLVLCTIGDPAAALAEARRVLRPGGRLIVLEHVRGRGAQARWQDVVTPLWRVVGAGCHPNRDTRSAVERAGFSFAEVEEFRPMPAVIPMSPMLQGVAVAV